ncbi:sensor histidine kinase [Desulfolucanica intricata]|uniref:sensor histidine kinase n=1 Tax=Desulfolucanica intricata TaxID=1285191 RepID=UPI000829AA02|nr:PocR ligand-binding domain-containing protein [Desulfolucanica intricata]
MNNCTTLVQLIEKDKFIKIIESFTNATDITIDINDCTGYPVVEHSFFYGFCKKIRSTPKGLERCIRSNAEIGTKTKTAGDVCFGTCHTGITLMAKPIVVDGQYWGSLACGQMHLAPPDEKQIQEMLKNTSDLGLDQEELVRDYKKIQVISLQKCRAAAQLIHFVTSYITELIYRSNIKDELAQRELRSAREATARAELEHALRIAELRNLQAQIKPHFLFNTLNTITGLVTLGENEKALKNLYALSGLLRYNVEQPKELVSVRDELRYVKSYLLIQKTRFDQKMNFIFDIDEDLMELTIPFLSIQPLVENACGHGLEPKEGTGTLRITGRVLEDKAVITVIDDGVGITPEKLKVINNSFSGPNFDHGVGLKNVHRRLQLYFGPAHGVQIYSSPEETRVSISIPLIPPEQGELHYV